MANKINELNISNAKLIFKNFAGKETKYNRAGNRNFAVLIEDPVFAEQLARDGWNVKTLPPREGEEFGNHYISVTVRFDNFPPKIIMIANRKKTLMNELSVDSLDYAEIENVDLIINPSYWEANGKSGIKAYLKTMYVTIHEDIFAEKYSSYDF